MAFTGRGSDHGRYPHVTVSPVRRISSTSRAADPSRGLRVFRDRADAGRTLADRLAWEGIRSGVVVGLARGGVEVAAEVARALGLPLDALAVRKIGAPHQPEYAIGAVTPGGGLYLRSEAADTREGVDVMVERARASAESLDALLHRGRAPVPVRGRRCILVDDGLATGATMVAAVDWARRQGAASIVVAVPVGAPSTVAMLGRAGHEVVCLEQPAEMIAVGAWYERFDQVPDERVTALLETTGVPVAQQVVVEAGPVLLPGELRVPREVSGAVIFAHGSGSSRKSPRNHLVAARLNESGLATLLFDLLSEAEAADQGRVFDVPLLGVRLDAARSWLRSHSPVGDVPFGYFGASTGAAAALWAAADADDVCAIVSRGGRPDLAGSRLAGVTAPTLLIVGGEDRQVLELNQQARSQMRCITDLVTVPGATHLFEEPGALGRVAALAAGWFTRYC